MELSNTVRYKFFIDRLKLELIPDLFELLGADYDNDPEIVWSIIYKQLRSIKKEQIRMYNLMLEDDAVDVEDSNWVKFKKKSI